MQVRAEYEINYFFDCWIHTILEIELVLKRKYWWELDKARMEHPSNLGDSILCLYQSNTENLKAGIQHISK